MADGIDATTAGMILDELKDLKVHGCREGTKNATNIKHLQTTQVQHDERIVSTEKDVSGITTTMADMPEQVSTKVINKLNGSLKNGARTIIPVNAFGIKFSLPASWLGWIAAIGILLFVASIHFKGYKETTTTIQELRQAVHIQAGTNGIVLTRSHPTEP